MIDKIITFGDSFLFGSDLKDCIDINTFEEGYSYLTWPALISKQLRIKYESYALGGVGNQFIMEQILDRDLSNSLIVVNWTWIDRFDYHNYDDEFDKNNPYKTIMPGLDTEESKFYYKHLHSEITDKLRNLCFIHTAIEHIKDNGNPFVSTVLDQLIFDQQWHMSSAIEKMQKKVRLNTSFFPNDQTFLEWSRANGYPESDNWHPLEQAHKEAARYWKPIYEKLINTYITTTKD